MPHEPGEPRDGPAMVAICCRDEGEGPIARCAVEYAMNGPRCPKCLERWQPETRRLVLGQHEADPELGGQLRQADERGRGIAVQSAMECVRLG